jgi:lipoprotein NlpD
MGDRWCRQLLTIPAVLCVLLSCSGPVRVHQGVTGIYYEVKPGDTLNRISRTYQVSTTELAAANRLKNLDDLTPGMVLFIPRAQTGQEKPLAQEERKGPDKPRPPAPLMEPRKGQEGKAKAESKSDPKKEVTGTPGQDPPEEDSR